MLHQHLADPAQPLPLKLKANVLRNILCGAAAATAPEAAPPAAEAAIDANANADVGAHPQPNGPAGQGGNEACALLAESHANLAAPKAPHAAGKSRAAASAWQQLCAMGAFAKPVASWFTPRGNMRGQPQPPLAAMAAYQLAPIVLQPTSAR